ncbi:MAG TPA: CheR family methyltransferase [Terriglobales bacterium]|nr:CheR family methyltransferase [Terriglobales bacterium]
MLLDEFLQVLAEERDLDLRGYKHTTLERRIRKRLSALGFSGYEPYIEYIRLNPGETNQLLDTILINVTEFFRDPAAWDVIAGDVLPYLMKRLRTGDSFRAWVAGCSTGEEVYSLAILIAEYFGPRLGEFDIKIYATDVDENALNMARRGEYPPERLRRVRAEWRHKYFSSAPMPRVSRELRRMLIFGRSDLAQDAPISHVQMVVCRNVLIYFDSMAQTHVLNRFHYALDPGGILFLGKAESKLSNSLLFKPVDSRWRIFRKDHMQEGPDIPRSSSSRSGEVMVTNGDGRQQELARLEPYYRTLLDVLQPGIFALDANDVVLTENKSALQLWGLSGNKLLGRHIAESAIASRCPMLVERVEESHRRPGAPVVFECPIKIDDQSRTLAVSVRPVNDDSGQRTGTLIYAEDVSNREKLQMTIEQLEATGEELQSANEELETTNEELQSTNEELETTNEELQSTNEELETTNEELQSLNEELENMNEELEFRTRELDQVNNRYSETIERMPWAVTVLDSEGRVQFWNSAAQRLFDLQARSVIGLELGQLPIEPSLREALVRRRKSAQEGKSPAVLRNQELKTRRSTLKFDVHLTPLSRDGEKPSLLLMFAPQEAAKQRVNSQPAKKSTKKKRVR